MIILLELWNFLRVRKKYWLPSISNGTTSVSDDSGPKTQRTECSGRTQVRLPGPPELSPQRMDFGQGKDLMMPGMNSAITSGAGRPGFSITAT